MISTIISITMLLLTSLKDGLLNCIGIRKSYSVDDQIGKDGEKSTGDDNMKKKIYKGLPKSGDPVYKNPDIYSTPSEIIERQGFACETHEVNTEDGYVLTLLRIPHRLNQQGNKNLENEENEKKRPAVLFVHGILTSGVVWVLNSKEKVLLYQLVDRGFDCWILHARGTEYSQKHSTLKTNTRQFWNFSWHEMADLDIPLVIDYILMTTSQKNLTYVGHSMGCSMLFAAVSLHPEISEKIKLLIAFAPAVYIKKATTPYVKLGAKIPGIQALVSCLYHGEFCLYPTLKIVQKLTPWLWVWKSRETREASWWCRLITDQVNGTDHEQINWSVFPVIAAHVPSPTSVKTYIHFLQLHLADDFKYFDYGRSRNIKEYGQEIPPTYDLKKSKFPVAVFCGENDACVHPDDAKRLANDLPNCILYHVVDWPKCNHTDYIFADDAQTLVNEHVLKLIDSQSSK